MDDMIYIIIGAVLTFFGVSYFQNKGAEKIEKKTKASNKRISNFSTANLVALANSILARRDRPDR